MAKPRTISFSHLFSPTLGLPLLLILGETLLLGLDFVMPVGFAVWAPYNVLVALALFASQVWLPLVIALIATVYMLLAFHFAPAPSTVLPHILHANRLLGVFTAWGTALAVVGARAWQRNECQTKARELEVSHAELTEKQAELARANRYKSEFVAHISHDLRTPLASLLLLARQLMDNKTGNLSREQTEQAGMIFALGNDLMRLIRDILDLSKVEAGKLDVHTEDVDVGDLLATALRKFKAVAHDRGVDFTTSLDPDVPLMIRTDRQRLEQILDNFLSNSFKFTKAGRVSLCLKQAKPPFALALAVRDTGIGIPLDKQRLIFEAFEQGDRATARTYGGTGLGLSIASKLARLLGGVITVESQPGRGSTFTLMLPQALPQERGPAGAGASFMLADQRPAG